MTVATLPFGPLDASTVHICIDMQRLFQRNTVWASDAVDKVLPRVEQLARHASERTLFTRFITPQRAEDCEGAWRRYYRAWSSVTLERMDPVLLDLVAPLPELAAPNRIFDKTTIDAFACDSFRDALNRLAPTALIFSGVETDVCVLASLFSATDAGFRCILASDAAGSSSAEGHAAVLEAIMPRFDQQIEVATTECILANWSA